jgi:hypothetical protein
MPGTIGADVSRQKPAGGEFADVTEGTTNQQGPTFIVPGWTTVPTPGRKGRLVHRHRAKVPQVLSMNYTHEISRPAGTPQLPVSAETLTLQRKPSNRSRVGKPG